MAPISLKTTSIVNPSILNGSKINQMIGNSINSTRASGQHKTNNMQISKSAKRVLINKCFADNTQLYDQNKKCFFTGISLLEIHPFSNPYSIVIAFVQQTNEYQFKYQPLIFYQVCGIDLVLIECCQVVFDNDRLQLAGITGAAFRVISKVRKQFINVGSSKAGRSQVFVRSRPCKNFKIVDDRLCDIRICAQIDTFVITRVTSRNP